jgi:hypothetical protein
MGSRQLLLSLGMHKGSEDTMTGCLVKSLSASDISIFLSKMKEAMLQRIEQI